MWIVTQNGRLLNTDTVCWFRLAPCTGAWDIMAEIHTEGPCDTRIATFTSEDEAKKCMQELAKWLDAKTPGQFVNTPEKRNEA